MRNEEETLSRDKFVLVVVKASKWDDILIKDGHFSYILRLNTLWHDFIFMGAHMQ